MKRVLVSFITMLLLFCFTGVAFATIVCTQDQVTYGNINTSKAKSVVLTCVGTTGSVVFDDDSANFAMGKTLVGVRAYGGATLPDAADVTLTVLGQDLLGGEGVNLIPASTTPLEVQPYNANTGLYRYLKIRGIPTVTIANQGTSNANIIIIVDLESD